MFQFRGNGLWQTENRTYMGVPLKRKGKQEVREYLLNGPMRHFYFLYYFDAAQLVSFVDFLSVLLSSTAFNGRILLERCSKESFTVGAEISAIKEVELFC